MSLYEIADVWGYSDNGWTPLMLYLRGLFVYEAPEKGNKKEFFRETTKIHDPIFSLMYLNGTIRLGELQGDWTTPGPSPTNSVLLWPDTFNFFAKKAQEVIKRKKKL